MTGENTRLSSADQTKTQVFLPLSMKDHPCHLTSPVYHICYGVSLAISHMVFLEVEAIQKAQMAQKCTDRCLIPIGLWVQRRGWGRAGEGIGLGIILAVRATIHAIPCRGLDSRGGCAGRWRIVRNGSAGLSASGGGGLRRGHSCVPAPRRRRAVV